jgi:hypothetical protein
MPIHTMRSAFSPCFAYIVASAFRQMGTFATMYSTAITQSTLRSYAVRLTFCAMMCAWSPHLAKAQMTYIPQWKPGLVEPAYPSPARAAKVLDADQYHMYRLNMKGGVGRWFLDPPRKAPESVQEFYDRSMRNGFNGSAQLDFFLSDMVGLGARYHRFQSSGTEMLSLPNSDGQGLEDVNFRADNVHQFIGPELTMRWYSPDSRRAFLFSLGLGYMDMWLEERANDERTVTRGATTGLMADFGADFYTGDFIGLYVGLQLYMGSLREIKVTEGNNTVGSTLDRRDYISITHLALTLGVSLVR